MTRTDTVPLIVDLDGTLLPIPPRSIMVARLAWRTPSILRHYRAICRHDRFAAKFFLWERTGIDIDRMPIRTDLLRHLQAEAAAGRTIYIASGSPDGLVQELVERLGVFEAGWGSELDRKLAGPHKAAFLVERFGRRGFDYIGDAWEDLSVWQEAQTAILCWPTRRLHRAVRQVAPRVEVLPRPFGAPLITARQYTRMVASQVPVRRLPTFGDLR